MQIRMKRIYEPVAGDDGARVLIDRLWPRGISKERAQLTLWAKEIAPSNELRKWYDHIPARWEEFRLRYAAELGAHHEALAPLLQLIEAGPVTFLTSTAEPERNHGHVLIAYIQGYLDNAG